MPKPIHFNKTILGFNVTENGVKSYSKSIRVGPFQLTINASDKGMRGSVSLPGTGLSYRNIKIM